MKFVDIFDLAYTSYTSILVQSCSNWNAEMVWGPFWEVAYPSGHHFDTSWVLSYLKLRRSVIGKLAGSLLFTEIALYILCIWTSASCRDCCQDGTPFKVQHVLSAWLSSILLENKPRYE